MIARQLELNLQLYTYKDYLAWGEDVKCELIDGVVYNMASPTTAHQDLVSRLWSIFRDFLKGRRCKAYFAPLDVRLNAHSYDDIVVQPDVIILCDRSKLDPAGRGIIGAPDMIIEVLSPTTAYTDRVLKHQKYMLAGVKEYWIVDIENKLLEVYLLEGGKYFSQKHGKNGKVPVQTFPGLEIDLAEIFAEDTWDTEIDT